MIHQPPFINSLPSSPLLSRLPFASSSPPPPPNSSPTNLPRILRLRHHPPRARRRRLRRLRRRLLDWRRPRKRRGGFTAKAIWRQQQRRPTPAPIPPRPSPPPPPHPPAPTGSCGAIPAPPPSLGSVCLFVCLFVAFPCHVACACRWRGGGEAAALIRCLISCGSGSELRMRIRSIR